MTDQIRFDAICNLGVTRQTLNARINWLLQHKWINYNSKKGIYHVNSFRIIHRKTTSRVTKGVLWEDYEIKKFKAFVWAGVFGYFARRKRFIDQNELRLSDREKPRIRMKKARPLKNPGPCSYNLPLSYLAKALKKSKSTIQKMKALAERECFLEVENSFGDSNLSVPELVQLRRFAKNNPEIKKYVLVAGKVKEQLPDKIYLAVNYHNKRKLKHI